MPGLSEQIGITPAGIVGVIIATTTIYLIFTALMAVWGRRMRSSLSVFSFALITLAGSVAARSMLGNSPTLMGGLVALLTLFLLERLFRRIRIKQLMGLRRSAVAVVVDGQVQADLLHQCQFSEATLMARLRGAGVQHRNQVALAIVEPTGTLTVLRHGTPLDAGLLVGVQGVERLSAHLLDADAPPGAA